MSNSDQQAVLQLSEELFRPTDAHIRAKSQLWARFAENPICDPSEVNLAIASQYVNDRRLPRWWSQPGFQDWFLNRGEWRELLETTAYRALQKLNEIITLPTEPKVA